jgi:hypothetical protein
VGGLGAILTSDDAVNWVRRVSEVTNSLSAIAYGEGQFVAVGSAGTIVTSADAVNWVSRLSGVTNSLNAVVWGNAQFVAAGDLGTILSSPDGLNWGLRLSEGTNDLGAIAYGNGRFVAASDTATPGLAIATSRDGTTWVWQDAGRTGAGLSCVAFGNGQFVGVEQFGCLGPCSLVVSSTDGITWMEHQSTPSSPHAYGDKPPIAFGNGQFVFAANGLLWNSADGSNWVAHPDFDPAPLGICYGNGRFVTAGRHGSIRESGSIISLSLVPKGEAFALSLSGPSNQACTIQSSADLISWQTMTNVTLPQSNSAIFDVSSAGSDRVFYRAYSQ